MDPNAQEFFDDVLAHHGVKGQKWGVRRTPAQLGHKPSGSRRKMQIERGKQKLSGLRKKKTTKRTVVRRKYASEFSDAELEKAINRLKLEKTYNQLVSDIEGQNRSKSGKSAVKFVADQVLLPAVKDAGKEIIKNAIKDAASDALKKKRESNS